MSGNSRRERPASWRAEVAGWLAFLLFVAGVYRLRRLLDRSAPER
jgi:hypothetical protein